MGARARTEEQRKRFLGLARDWTQAAFEVEGMPVPSEPDTAVNAQSEVPL